MIFLLQTTGHYRALHSFPTRRSSDLAGSESVALFEIGRVFDPPNGQEKRRAAILLWGERASQVHWRSEKRRFDFFDLKSAVDRKSTRLNSSHPSISYAVFCLKKKKKE